MRGICQNVSALRPRWPPHKGCVMAEARDPKLGGFKELHIALPDAPFDEIVNILRKVWVVPDLPGIRGCNPCRSGLDRFIIEDPAFRAMRR